MAHDFTDLLNSKVSPRLEQQFFQESTTGWMERNSIGVEYRGAKYVYLPEMIVDGMADYSRTNGFVNGSISGAKQQFEMTQDRGRRFPLDYIDADETNFVVNSASVMAQYNRDWVIPEIDCYRYSKMYAAVNADQPGNIDDTAVTKANLLQEILTQLAEVRDIAGFNVQMVIIMSGITQQYLGSDWQRTLEMTQLFNGQVNVRVKGVDGNPVLPVPSARLKSEYQFLDGITAGQEKGGFKPTDTAKDIKWIITPATAPIACKKRDRIRVFDPDTNQQFDGWAMDHRIYHDLWMTKKGTSATYIKTGDIT